MALSAFEDKSHAPAPGDLETVLGPSSAAWLELVRSVGEQHAPVDESWNFAGAKFGWSLRLRRKERVLLYLIPQAGHFLAGIVLGERAVKAARDSRLPRAVIETIDGARPYAEGRGIRLPIVNREDLAAVLELVALKVG